MCSWHGLTPVVASSLADSANQTLRLLECTAADKKKHRRAHDSHSHRTAAGDTRVNRWPILFVGLSVALSGHAQDAADASLRAENARLRAEVNALRQAVQNMESRLDVIEHAQTRTPADREPTAGMSSSALANRDAGAQPDVQKASVSTATAVGVPPGRLPAQNSVADPGAGASRPDNAPSPTDPDLQGFIDIPGTETKVRIGGYAKLDVVADNHDAGNDEQFIPALFPAGMDSRDHRHFNMHARQTRFSFEARRPTDYGSLRFYLENDFFGSDPNSYQFHVRHAFGQIGNTYAGYGYSAFMDPDALPDTLDFAGPGGQMYVLQPGIHQSFPFGDGNSLTISGERPQTEVDAPLDAAATKGATRVPDLVVALRTERTWGHLQAGALLRRLGYTDGPRSSYANGWGVAVSGTLAAAGQDLFMFSGVYGHGISRYLSDASGSGLDALVGTDRGIHPLKAWGWYGAYTHYWSPLWRSNLVYGQAHVPGREGLDADDFKLSDYTALNLIWSPAPTWTMGVELLWGTLEQQGKARANDTRVQGSVQYNFIR